jgi:MFS family permease
MYTRKLGNKNFIFMTLEGSLFFLGVAFLGENTIVPIFVDTYTGSMQLLGLTTTLITAAKLLPRVLIGPYISRNKDMIRLLRIVMFMHRPMPILMVPVLLLVKNPFTVFLIFLGMYCIFWGIQGIAAVTWTDIFGRTIPGNRRGQLQGYQQFLGGTASLIAGYIIKLILDNSDLTNNTKYMIIFAIGSVILLMSAIVILPVKDVERKRKNENVNLIQYFSGLPSYFNKNKNYRRMVVLQAISRLGDVIIPFILVLSKNNLGFTSSRVSTLVVFQLVGAMVGGILWGNISRRFGNKQVIIIAEAVGLCISTFTLICILSNLHFDTFLIMCLVVTLAGIKTGAWLGYSNYLLDVVGETNRIEFMTLNTIILFPLSFANYLAGLANDKLGFLPLIAFTVLIGFTCSVLALKLKTVKPLH